MDPIPTAQKLEIRLYVLVCRAIMAMRRLADLNAILLQTACYLEPVSTKNVLIRVLVRVAIMQSVELYIILPFVHVHVILPVTHMTDVFRSLYTNRLDRNM